MFFRYQKKAEEVTQHLNELWKIASYCYVYQLEEINLGSKIKHKCLDEHPP